MTPLVVENITKVFRQGEREVTALGGVDLQVPSGRFLAIMGASGSGKSTLLHLMAGLTRPTAGRILINSEDITGMNDRQLTLFRRHHIGLVFQSFNLIPTLTARDNLALPLLLDGRRPADLDQRTDRLMEMLGIAHRGTHRPDVLSGGEQQRVAIGRALVTEPAIILADEPTGNLDSANSRSVCELLRDLAAIHGRTIVMVTHEPSVAAYAQQVVILKDGHIVESFSTDQLEGTQELALRYQEAVR